MRDDYGWEMFVDRMHPPLIAILLAARCPRPGGPLVEYERRRIGFFLCDGSLSGE